MKKILALILALVMALSLVACGSKDDNDTPDDGKKTNTIKVGLICIGDENDQGYTYNFIRGKEAATEALAAKGINVEWVIKYNKGENDDCTNANIECAEEGCQLIINNSYGHEPFMLKVAGKSEYKDIQFIGCTNCASRSDDLENTHNAFANIYEGRYLAGVVAGMKLKELMDAGTVTDPKVGYVGAYPYAEVVCGYTAFLLGIQTQVPEAYMEVQYTNSWYDPVAEGEAANALMARGCVIIGQHADSTGAPSAVQAQKDAGSVVYSVGYNIDMLEVAPTAALTSSQNNWSVLYRDTLEKFIAGEEVPVDYAVGISEDAVMISKLGPECAEGTQEAVDAAWSSIKDGSLKVFDTSKFTCQPAADGSYQVDADGHVTSAFGLDSDGDFVNDTGEAIVDGAFQESVLRSAPYFSLRIDGITELNNN